MNGANGKRSWEKLIAATGLAVAVLFFSGIMLASDGSLLLKISKSIDVFGRCSKK